MTRFSRHTTRNALYIRLRKQGMNSLAARKKAERMFDEYTRMMRVKERKEIGTRAANWEAKLQKNREGLRREFAELTHHDISFAEAEVIGSLFHKLHVKIKKRGIDYSAIQFFIDYANVRFSQQSPEPVSTYEILHIAAAIAKKYRVKVTADDVSSIRIEQSPDTMSQFHFWREAERTNSTHKIKYQQTSIEMIANKIVSNMVMDGIPFLRRLKTTIEELKKPPTPEEIKAISQKAYLSKKPADVQRRIIEAKRVEMQMKPFIQAIIEEIKMVGLVHMNLAGGEKKQYYYWLLESLERPTNRLFLQNWLMNWGKK